jgi:glutathione S-transferase
MKLYDAAFPPSPRRVRIFLAEKGLDIPCVHVDLAAMEHRGADFSAINPLQRVPALELDDGTIITESAAICRYIEALNPEPPLFGRNAKEVALVDMWMRRVEFGLYATIAAVFRHSHPAMKTSEVPQCAEWAELNKPRVLEELAFLNSALEGRQWLATADYTAADIALLCSVDFMRPIRIAIPDTLTHLKRWHDAASNRPSAKA